MTTDDILARLSRVHAMDRKEFVDNLSKEDLDTLHKYLEKSDQLDRSSMLHSTLMHVNARLAA